MKQFPYAATLDVRDHCLCLAAQRAARVLARKFDVAFQAVGLTNGQFSLMMSLNRPAPGLTIGAAASFLAMDRTTLTAALKPLVKRGLVDMTEDPSDRRSRLLTLTEEGHAVLLKAYPIWEATHREIDQKLGEPGGEALRGGLQAVL
ncbi:transcriptional regulator [Sneathiella chinensis]|uniref:Transcriptional regulator n=2 Tax=Sneathiella chinensis TaxID=349750 RepID=A0ABQ5U2S1_9PROT|nr:MarR family transcriptional regulator [Sneathiella chinensis]GLQ06482.1 transcriptional regulator [Sneathiella chinensis]